MPFKQLKKLFSVRNSNASELSKKSYSENSKYKLDVNSKNENFYNVYGFGSNDWGQLGLNDGESPVTYPTLINALISLKVKLVSCGWSHTVFIVNNVEVYQVGNRVSTGLEKDLVSPEKLNYNFQFPVIQICCGENHTVALDEKGGVYCWGSNFYGQLGLGHFNDQIFPAKLDKLKDENIVSISTNKNFTLALSENGKVFSWGENFSGALGHGNKEDINTPTLIEALKDIKISLVSAGGYHSIAVVNEKITGKSTFYGWGWNECGQLGIDDVEDKLEPTKSGFELSGEIKMVSCGSSHTAIIFESISPKECCLYACGSNKSGQLGIPITNETSFLKLPTSVKLSGSPEFVECGSNHTFLKFSDNAIFSTGNNLRNQTGIVSKAAYENYKNEKKLGQKNINSNENSRSRRTFLKHKKIPIQSKIDSEIEAPIFYNEKFEKVLLLEKKSVSRIVCGGDCTLILTVKEWIEDAETSECMGKYAPNCKEKFSFVVRKHHCRYCGGIFCYVCANRFVYTNSKNSVRYCDRCYEQIK